jgi:hypothetical protein
MVISGLFFSCGPVLYPNVGQNVPLFQEKGEFSGQVSYSASDGAWVADGVGLQGAYSFSDKVAAIGSFYSMKAGDPDAGDEWEGNGSYFEVGVGMYGGKPEKKFLYEGFLGIGSGSINNKSMVNPGNFINVAYIKPFIQPSLGFTTKYFDMALTPRIAYLSYNNTADYYFSQVEGPIDPSEYFEKNDNIILFEPGIMLRGGFPGVKLELQYNISTIQDPLENYYLVNNEFFSIGLRFMVSQRYSEK